MLCVCRDVLLLGRGSRRVGVVGVFLWASAALCQARSGRDKQGIAPRSDGTLVQQSWSTDDGLPQNSVHAILQTHDGFLWVATEGGLARFDGVNFRVFRQVSEHAFASDDISCLAEDSRGALWIGTADGLVRESGGRFEHFGAKDGLPAATILDLAPDADGSVLALTAGGVALVDLEGRIRALQVPGGDSVLAMSRSTDGSVWLITANGLFQYKSGELHREQVPIEAVSEWRFGTGGGPGSASCMASIGR